MKAFLTIAIILVSLPGVFACRCQDAGTISEAFNYSETIVQGQVIKKSIVTFQSAMNQKKVDALKIKLKDNSQKLLLLESEFIVEIQLKILRVYKGEVVGDTITIYTPKTNASCGYTSFEEGKDFIIYASSSNHPFSLFDTETELERENTLWTNHCTRTKEFNAEEAKELELLMKK